MTAKEYPEYIVQQIHSTVAATVDEDGLPVTCVIDIMYADENGLYFLTAKGKSFYKRLKNKEFIALSGKKGEDTMSCVAVSVRGKVREIGTGMLPVLFEKNPYMCEIYPTEESRKALTVFQLCEGSGEWFQLFRTAMFKIFSRTFPRFGHFISRNIICDNTVMQNKHNAERYHRTLNNCFYTRKR